MTIDETGADRAAEATLRRQREEAAVYGEPKGPLPPRILRRPKQAIEAAAAGGTPEPPSPRPPAERDRDGFYGGLTTAEAILRAPEQPELGRVATIDPTTGAPLGLPHGVAEGQGEAMEDGGSRERPPAAADASPAPTTGGDTEPPPRDPVPPPQAPTPPPRPDHPERLPSTPTPPIDPLPVSDPPVPEIRYRGG